MKLKDTDVLCTCVSLCYLDYFCINNHLEIFAFQNLKSLCKVSLYGVVHLNGVDITKASGAMRSDTHEKYTYM